MRNHQVPGLPARQEIVLAGLQLPSKIRNNEKGILFEMPFGMPSAALNYVATIRIMPILAERLANGLALLAGNQNVRHNSINRFIRRLGNGLCEINGDGIAYHLVTPPSRDRPHVFVELVGIQSLFFPDSQKDYALATLQNAINLRIEQACENKRGCFVS